MLPTSAGIEPATSWSPVGRRIQLSHRGRQASSWKGFTPKGGKFFPFWEDSFSESLRPVFAKTEDCLKKLANFYSVLQKISVCLTNVLWFLAKSDSNLITNKPPVLQNLILSCQKFQSVWQLSCICWKDFAKTVRQIHMYALRKHAYSNIWKISPPKTENFQTKISDSLHIFAQNIDCEYSLEPPWWGGSNEYHNLCFWAEIRKIMYTPVNPSLTI